MLNYGFNNSINPASTTTGDAWQGHTEKNKDGDHSGLAQFGVPGSRDLQGDGVWGFEEIQMPESDGVAYADEKRNAAVQFPEVGNGAQVRQTAFWLDVVPGV